MVVIETAISNNFFPLFNPIESCESRSPPSHALAYSLLLFLLLTHWGLPSSPPPLQSIVLPPLPPCLLPPLIYYKFVCPVCAPFQCIECHFGSFPLLSGFVWGGVDSAEQQEKRARREGGRGSRVAFRSLHSDLLSSFRAVVARRQSQIIARRSSQCRKRTETDDEVRFRNKQKCTYHYENVSKM